MSIHEVVNNQVAPPTLILSQIDLVEYEAEQHWTRYQQALLEAWRRLALYNAAMDERRQLSEAITSALAEVEELLR